MLYHGDCLELLDRVDKVKAIFADPPDNIGYKYSGFEDSWNSNALYYQFIELLVRKAMGKCGIFWLSYNSIHDPEIPSIFATLKKSFPSWQYRLFLWRYTFGQYNDKECSHGFRPIILWKSLTAELNYDAIREPSKRMMLGDARAAGPRIPDDVWEFPRVVGNFPERRAWHPTQHPQQLLRRIKLLSNGSLLDCFLGSGTSKIIDPQCIGIEWSDVYIRELEKMFGPAVCIKSGCSAHPK
jgi:DNA modification methylase